MSIQNIPVKILAITNSIVQMEIGNYTVDLSKENIAQLRDPAQYDPLETVLRNIGMRLVGVSLNDPAAITAAIDGVSFRMVQ